MPRVKSPPKKCIKTSVENSASTWVFLLKGEALEVPEQYTGTGTPDVVTLRHPNTGKPAVFLFSPANNSVQEILTFNEAKRSWFIDESVKSDGKMHLSTPIDPIFLVLPYLKKYCQTLAIPLDQLLRDDDFPETERLIKSNGLKYLNVIADRKGDEELNAFKYNEEKTLTWLQKKTERVAEILKQKNIHVGGGAVSATFIKTNTDNKSSSTEFGAESEAYLRYAHGIVSEYLVDDLSQKLLKHLKLPDETENTAAPNLTSNKRKSSSSCPQTVDSTFKKARTSDMSEDEISLARQGALDLSNLSKGNELGPKKTPIHNSKEKARAKAASGTKTISSFFKKK